MKNEQIKSKAKELCETCLESMRDAKLEITLETYYDYASSIAHFLVFCEIFNEADFREYMFPVDKEYNEWYIKNNIAH